MNLFNQSIAQKFNNAYQKNFIVFGQENSITLPIKHPENTTIYATTNSFIGIISDKFANPYFQITKTNEPGTYSVTIQPNIESSSEPFDKNITNGEFVVYDSHDTTHYYFNIIYPKIKTDVVLSTGFDKNISIDDIDSSLRIIPYCTIEDFPNELLKSPNINSDLKILSCTLYASGDGFPIVKIFSCSGNQLPKSLINQLKNKDFKRDGISYLTLDNIKVMTPKGVVTANPISFTLK